MSPYSPLIAALYSCLIVLFSYYLMRGLSGEADANHDNRLTAGELHDYVRERVQRVAMTQGRPQVPEITGERDKVIAAWGR